MSVWHPIPSQDKAHFPVTFPGAQWLSPTPGLSKRRVRKDCLQSAQPGGGGEGWGTELCATWGTPNCWVGSQKGVGWVAMVWGLPPSTFHFQQGWKNELGCLMLQLLAAVLSRAWGRGREPPLPHRHGLITSRLMQKSEKGLYGCGGSPPPQPLDTCSQKP